MVGTVHAKGKRHCAVSELMIYSVPVSETAYAFRCEKGDKLGAVLSRGAMKLRMYLKRNTTAPEGRDHAHTQLPAVSSSDYTKNLLGPETSSGTPPRQL